MAVPLLLGCVVLASALRDVDVYAAMTKGAGKGLRVLAAILPSLLVLFPAIALFRASGLPELLGRFLRPVFTLFGVPEETALLMLLRPLSGSGALSAAAELMARCGPDSLVGRTAAVMIGSSETTLYVIAVYLGTDGAREGGRVLPAALLADLTCFLSSAWICRLLWG